MRTAKYILALIAAIMVVTGCDWIRMQLGMATSDDIEAIKKKTAEEESVKVVIDSTAIKEAQEREREKKEEEIKLQKAAVNRFHVIIGSFKKHSNAQRAVEYLEKKGYTPHVFEFKNGFMAVSAASFPYLAPAYTEMYNIMDRGMWKDDLWIYDIKQNMHK